MTTLVREPMPRGVKLTKEMVNTLLASAASDLSGSVTAASMASPNAPWEMEFYFPLLTHLAEISQTSEATVTAKPLPYGALFIPAATQDVFLSASQASSAGTKPQPMLLDELHFGWDQREEPGFPRGNLKGYGNNDYAYQALGPNTDSLSFVPTGDSGQVVVTVRLYEKTPNIFQATGACTLSPDRLLLEIEIPATAWGASSERVNDDTLSDEEKAFRLNPLAITGLGLELDPLKSYLLTVQTAGLAHTTTHDSFCMPNVQVTLKGRTILRARDGYNGNQYLPNIQNAPVLEVAPSSRAIAVTSPVLDQDVNATGSKGVSHEIRVIDAELQKGLDGHMDRYGMGPPKVHVQDVCGYEIIAVPLWGHVFPYGKVSSTPSSGVGNFAPMTPDVSFMPYAWDAAGASWKKTTGDRRFIRIRHPFVIHHVLASRSRLSPVLDNTGALDVAQHLGSRAGVWPISNTVYETVRVKAGSGIRSDKIINHTIAEAEWTPATRGNYIIDRMSVVYPEYRIVAPNATDGEYQLYNIPIVTDPAAPMGLGFTSPQGAPFWVGEGSSHNANRTYAWAPPPAAGLYVPPYTNGQEQFLEVSWEFRDVNGLEYTGGAGKAGKFDCYVGLGGCWVYLIGKRFLTDGGY